MHASLEDYLDTPEGAGRVMAHARLILKLARRLEKSLPPGLGHASQVANYKSGTVVIHAENGAVAAKIRQMGRRLCDELSKEGVECNGMEVKVQPRQIPWQSMASTPKPLSAGACGAVESAAREMPPGPLKSALEELLRRAARQE